MAALVGAEQVRRDTALPDGGAVYLERLLNRLLRLMEHGLLGAVERAEAGRVLARLGDPRAGVTSVEEMEFCWVPAGAFWMGEGKEAKRNESVDYACWMGRYPVTNAQFKDFVDAGGYREPRYWSEAMKHGVWTPPGAVRGRWDREPRLGPHDFGVPFTLPNHPVVGITWYEALAYTRWLTEHLNEKQRLPEGYGVRLASEAEWAKAARGGVELPAGPVLRTLDNLVEDEPASSRIPNPEAKRRYPWGAKAEPERANYDATHVGSTSAVGCFPLGASPYGCQDMAGSVWEWTQSASGKRSHSELDAGPEVPRVLRGGGFLDVESFLRCSDRYRDLPGGGDWGIGFRVVVSPSTSGL